MLKCERCVTPSPDQWVTIIQGTRNPFNSWVKSDSGYCHHIGGCDRCRDNKCALMYTDGDTGGFYLGKDDYDLMIKLRNAGTDHRKFMRMITVYVDITAPLYWWKEFDTYKVGTVANSCSTMHTIHKKEFTLDDFSHERLLNPLNYGGSETKIPFIDVTPDKDGNIVFSPFGVLKYITIPILNECRKRYVEYDGCDDIYKKDLWYQMIQLLPTSYNQKRTVMLNYEVLANIYKSRKNHKLQEWHTLCDFIEGLPYSELITGEKENG